MSIKQVEKPKQSEPVIENFDIKVKHPEYSQLLEYKFILYKFPKPIEKNIQSLQVVLEPSDSLQNKGLYISLNANFLQLTTPMKIYPNVLTQILQYPYLPTQLTPEYQFQLISTIENLQTSDSSHLTLEKTELQFNLKIIIKYFLYENIQLTDKLIITHNNDIKTLVVKNGNMYFTKVREIYGSSY